MKEALPQKVSSLIAEILPESYDIAGRKVFRPDSRHHSGFRPTFPIGRFLSQPLKHRCSNFDELRQFLASCKYISDQEQFGEKDYWQPPEHFEESQKGDCEDYALWAWRQLLEMNYPARFVTGTSGRYGAGHAWVTFEKNGKAFLLEPLAWPLGLRLPRLSIVRYKPKFSVAVNGDKVSYYEHEEAKFRGSFVQISSMIFEWLLFWSRFWITFPLKLARRLTLRTRVRLRG
jgi:hypothetical protein